MMSPQKKTFITIQIPFHLEVMKLLLIDGRVNVNDNQITDKNHFIIC